MQPDVCFLGIPIGTDVRNVRLAREVELPERQTFGTWEVARSGLLGEVLSVSRAEEDANSYTQG